MIGQIDFMDHDVEQVLKLAFPGEDARYFSPMSIGSTPASADAGAAAILHGIKTTTSSGFWNWPDGRIPFAGALTERVEIIPFGSIDESFAWSYGEGERTLTWWQAEMGAFNRESAARHGVAFSEDTPLICEWIAVVKRL